MVDHNPPFFSGFPWVLFLYVCPPYAYYFVTVLHFEILSYWFYNLGVLYEHFRKIPSAFHHHLLTFSTCWFFLYYQSHLSFGLSWPLIPSGIPKVNIFVDSLSSILTGCISHLSQLALIIFTISGTLYNWQSSLLYHPLHYLFSYSGPYIALKIMSKD
jgi:hypothetical protein